jgi:hypothetical protein
VSVKWVGESKLELVPDWVWTRGSVMFPAGREEMSGEIEMLVECKNGGKVWIDHVSVQVGWVG